ncbi:MAG: AAA family ATPase [Bacteroidia bacterium]
MYIKNVTLENIQSIHHFSLEFPQYAGWHVIIGDNGTGKTGILRAISVCLCGPGRFKSFLYNEKRFLRLGQTKGSIQIDLIPSTEEAQKANIPPKQPQTLELTFSSEAGEVFFSGTKGEQSRLWRGTYEWFSASFGPFRRLTGGNSQYNKLFDVDHRVAAHISLFESEVAYVMVDEWLSKLQFRKLEKQKDGDFIDRLQNFINQDSLLPNGFKLSEISSEGVFFTSPQGDKVPIDWLSEGYRSVLSLMLELIRQMTIFFPEKKTEDFFEKTSDGNLVISLEGVVLIDEVDAHLHPTWQTRIGYWLIKYFPKIQFIVTTHSPLICRASEFGSIWRIAASESQNISGQVEGTEFQRLVYGNILDAYGTEVFGENITSSFKSTQMREKLADLNKKSFRGSLSKQELTELEMLRKILPTGV